MTREEIVKALRACSNEKTNCSKCPMWDSKPDLRCMDLAMKRAADMLEQDAKTGWISVKDRLPDEEEDVLLLVREVEHYGRHAEKRNVYRWVFTGWRVDDEWATTYCHGYKRIQEENEKSTYCEHMVTHWMPLPEPPKEAIK